jgi:hypothetical protein
VADRRGRLARCVLILPALRFTEALRSRLVTKTLDPHGMPTKHPKSPPSATTKLDRVLCPAVDGHQDLPSDDHEVAAMAITEGDRIRWSSRREICFSMPTTCCLRMRASMRERGAECPVLGRVDRPLCTIVDGRQPGSLARLVVRCRGGGRMSAASASTASA